MKSRLIHEGEKNTEERRKSDRKAGECKAEINIQIRKTKSATNFKIISLEHNNMSLFSFVFLL